MSINLRESKLIDNAPASISYDPQTQAICTALDRQFKETIDAINECLIIPNIDNITDPLLIDLLAFQFHVDFYEPNAPLAERKNLVKQSLTWHMRKGTVGLVDEVINTYFANTRLLEWFHYHPKPHSNIHDAYRFMVLVGDSVVSAADEAKVLELIDLYKPVSRWPEDAPIVRGRVSRAYLYVAIVCVIYRSYSIDVPVNWP